MNQNQNQNHQRCERCGTDRPAAGVRRLLRSHPDGGSYASTVLCRDCARTLPPIH